jgi:hypothetical protein
LGESRFDRRLVGNVAGQDEALPADGLDGLGDPVELLSRAAHQANPSAFSRKPGRRRLADA